MTVKEKKRLLKYIKENYTKIELKHLIVDLEGEKNFGKLTQKHI